MSEGSENRFIPRLVWTRNDIMVSKILRLVLPQIILITLFSLPGCAETPVKDGTVYAVNTPTSPLSSAVPTEKPSATVAATLSLTPVLTPLSTTLPEESAIPLVLEIVQKPYIGIWISKNELAELPTHGTAWEALKTAADKDPGKPDLKDQDENNDVYVLAKALVYARTGVLKYREEVIDNLMKAIDTEKGGRTLAFGRNLPGYVISADLVNLPADSKTDAVFRSWLERTLTENLDGRSLQSTHEDRPNNWGTHAGAARAAVALYLGDKAELERTALVFHGYVGDIASYNKFKYDVDRSWQCYPCRPVGINPLGCMKEGHSIDGALPEEMRRGDSFRWPPVQTGYAWEALQGVFVQAEILNRAGFPTWDWQDKALLRAVNFLYSIDWKPEGDDEWLVWLINHVYETNFSTVLPARPGKNMGWTDWTHAKQ